MKPKSTNLHSAKKKKNDEFYTQRSDIENELKHYKSHFKDKIVFCNCDDPTWSEFWLYFSRSFSHLGLKKLISTHYVENGSSYMLEMDETGTVQEIPLNGNGDFRSHECIELLKQADIVVTNPPFSLFREYVSQLMEFDKKFLIIGNNNAVTYKDIFSHIKGNRIWTGVSPRSMSFRLSDGSMEQVNANWFTNLRHKKRHEEVDLFMRYHENPERYPKYDNYDAIEVSKTKDIPEDYDGVMGVPITFLDKYNPEQFDIIGITKTWFGGASKIYPKQVQVHSNGRKTFVSKLNDGAALRLEQPKSGSTYYIVDESIFEQVYARILIRRRK